MSIIKPFRALRPVTDKAKQVACVPYDVVYEPEVRAFIDSNPFSFLRVTRAEAEFPEGSKTPPEAVFARARQNLERFIKDGVLVEDPDRAFYVYQLIADSHTQTGLVGCVAIDDYESGHVKKHENVRPDKVEDRLGHMLAVRSQTGLIFMAFRGTARIREMLDETTATTPLYEFECPQGVLQRVWRAENTDEWAAAFTEVPDLYIADGHHRAESARLARENMRGENPSHTGNEDYNFVVAGMFPAEDLQILPYNRVVKDLNGLAESEFFERVQESYVLVENGKKTPQKHGEVCMYIAGCWHDLQFNVKFDRDPDPIERLDVSLLESYILKPILGIKDARTDNRIGFVGGARGTAELERIVNEGIAIAAFSMYPTTMEDLLAVSDMGEVMPPKSTWFEPKLKDGLLVHQI